VGPESLVLVGCAEGVLLPTGEGSKKGLCPSPEKK